MKTYPYSIENNSAVKKLSLAVNDNATNRTLVSHPVDIRFTRVSKLYPPDAFKNKEVIIFGVGGGRGLAELLARSGVERFYLFDHDKVEMPNIASQLVFSSEFGQYKVSAVKQSILDINPNASVTAIPRKLDDQISDENFEGMIGDKLFSNPTDVLICGCTDSFPAQARSAALAMKYGTPYLAGQLYAGGEGGEVYFSYPGVTNSSCPRCALSSRYEAYAHGYQNNVTSESSPIFASFRMNAIEGQIAMMLLMYHEGQGYRYSDMLDAVADRNFVQVRISPYVGIHLGLKVFDRAMNSGYSFFDETVWIPQIPNNEANGYKPCPLCGGTGNLLALKNHIVDTREVDF